MAKKILVADDSITIQRVMKMSFANQDVELTVVDNGIDAVERTKELLPDLVMADVLMPGKNGYEVCREIKSNPATRHIPVLLLVGAFETFDENLAREAGYDGHITKPFDTATLLSKVKEALERRGEEVETEMEVEEEKIEAFQPEEGFEVVEEAMEPEEIYELITEEPEEGVYEPEEISPETSEEVEEAGEIELQPEEIEGEEFESSEFEEEKISVTEETIPVEMTMKPEEEIEAIEEAEELPAEEIPVEEGEVIAEEAPSPVEEFQPVEFEEVPSQEERVEEKEVFEEVERVEEAPAGEEVKPAEEGIPLSRSALQELVENEAKGMIREIVEKVVWEIVPDLAERIIKEELEKWRNKGQKKL